MRGLITRPQLPQLGLDLLEPVSGDGRFIFEGYTSEGRPYGIKYRSGYLQIWLEKPEDTLLQAHIGPLYHGDILFEQVCELTGMTISGRPAVVLQSRLEEMQEYGRYLDWSGATSYWERWFTVSKQGARCLGEAVSAAFPAAVPLKIQWEGQSRRCHRLNSIEAFEGATFVIGGSSRELERVLAASHVRIAEFQATFDHVIDSDIQPFFKHSAEEMSRTIGRPLELAETASGWIRASGRSGNERDMRFLHDLASAAGHCFFTDVDHIDVLDRKVLEPLSGGWWSTDLVDWCGSSPDRYLSAVWSSGRQRYVGSRPSASLFSDPASEAD
ncbi:hypothetical protein FFK22_041380 [Mycobacterium sp. KBS0706]|uniref:hypothetical protein n=1 Tax=Mycobacterium sp. KBS0706 TaxID=2578109 RepID=UPI00110F9C4B|nr:hypothetical protein [Mycobacterium sp. KBS0706]TSD82766.1 hypothetical protein FFK22_041380 [Mycobacterium sp. KBS0706]